MSEVKTTVDSFSWAEYYNKLGYLFYGILAAEGSVSADQLDMLRKHVHRLWESAPQKPLGFEGYMMAKVDSVFDWLNLNDADVNYCLSEFKFFINKYKSRIPAEMLQYISEQAKKVAAVMAGDENEVLKRLNDIIS